MQRLGRKLQRIGLFFISTLLLSSGIFADDHGASRFDENKLSEIKAQFDGYYLDGRIPNYAFGLYSKSGGSVYSAINGLTAMNSGNEVDLNTIYWLASMTKPVVSAAIMKLIEEGKLDLDDKLSEYFPEFSDMLVAPEGNYDNTLEEARRPITLRHLITHTSGLTYQPNVTGVGDVAKQYEEFQIMNCYTSGDDTTLSEHMEMLSQLPLIAHPGEAWNYSVGIDALGAVIEKVTGKKLDVYLAETFFIPLGMNDSFFYVPMDKRMDASRIFTSLDAASMPEDNPSAKINWKIIESETWKGAFEATEAPACSSGGGGLWASVNDFGRFLQMIANDGLFAGQQILASETVALMLENQTATLLPETFRRAFGEDASSFMEFTAGFGRKIVNDEVDYYFWGGAANTFFWMDKAKDHIGVFATQLIPSVYNVSDNIEEIVDQAGL